MAKDIVDVAVGEIGYREQGSNRTKYGAWYGMNGAPWCQPGRGSSICCP